MRLTGAIGSALGITVILVACGVGDIDLANRPCPCGEGFVCDPSRNVCVTPAELAQDSGSPDGAGPCLGDNCACATDPDCKDPAFSKCVDRKCVECTTGPDSCTAGRYCLPSHECAPGCKGNEECAALSPTAPFCNLGRHQCVECGADGDCTGGKKCSPAGACVVGCTTTCAGTATCCNGLCLDTKSDPLNCNACGTACGGASALCCAGTCADPLTSTANCGKCGTVCGTANATATACTAGSCKPTCTTGFSHCSSSNTTGCETNTSNNKERCGSCSKDCEDVLKHVTGEACVASVCTYTACNSGYANCNNNPADGCECSCGGLAQICCPGNVCSLGRTCVSGTCQ